MYNVSMPNLCARCGINEPSTTYSVSLKDRKPAGPARVEVTRVEIEAPLCEDCDRKLTLKVNVGRFMVIIGIIMFVFFLFSLNKDAQTTGRIVSNLEKGVQISIMVALLIFVGIGKYLTNPRLAKLKGRQLTFLNPTFQKRYIISKYPVATKKKA
jgi:hypothetical protein